MEFCAKHEPHIGTDHWQINMMFCNSPYCQIRVWFGVTSISAELPRTYLAQEAALGRMQASENLAGPLLTPGRPFL